MESTRTQEHWTYLDQPVANRWPELTPTDKAQIQSRLSRLAEVVEQRYRLTKEEAQRQVAEFEQTLENEARQAYAALAMRFGELKQESRLFARSFRHDLAEFGWAVTVERLVARYPASAIGIAAGVGAIIGASLTAGIAALNDRR